jgi:hypothetical protein
MADKAISQLDSATTLSSGDVLPIVNGGVTKKVTLATLFAQMFDATFTGLIKIGGSTETKSSGTLAVDRTISFVTNGSVSPVNIALPNPAQDMVKIIIANALSGDVNITSANGNGWSSLPLTTQGDCLILLYAGSKWNVLSK